MAKDPNKSTLPEANQKFSELERVGQSEIERVRGTKEYREILENQRKFEELQSKGHLVSAVESERRLAFDLLARTEAGRERRETLLDPFARSQAGQRMAHYAQNMYSGSSVNGESLRYSRSAEAAYEYHRHMDVPYESLEQRNIRARQNIEANRQRISDIVRGGEYHQVDESGRPTDVAQRLRKEVYSLINVNERSQRYVNQTDVALGQMRELGRDPASLMARGEKIVGGINEGFGGGSPSTDARSIKEIAEANNKLIQSLIKGKKEIEALSKQIDELGKASANTTDAEEKARLEKEKTELESKKRTASTQFQRDVGEYERNEAGAMASRQARYEQGSRLQAGGNMLGGIGSMLGAGSYAFREIAINQDIQALQNEAGISNIANQEYSMYKSAMHGDVLSQLRLLKTGDAHKFAASQKTQAQIAEIGDMVSTGLQGAGQVTNAVGSFMIDQATAAAGGAVGTAIGGPAAGGLLGGALEGRAVSNLVQNGGAAAAGTLASLAVQQRAYSRNINSDPIYIQSYSARSEADRAKLQISAEQLQEFANLGGGLTNVASDMTAAAGTAFMREAVAAAQGDRVGPGGQVTSRLSRMGMGQEEFVRAAQFGANNLGNTFGVGQIEAAQNLMKGGVGTSAIENLQRFAVLQGAGSNNPTQAFGSVLEAAMTKSLNNAKTLNMMVQYSADMARSSTGQLLGIDTTKGQADLLAGLTRPNSGEFGLQRARSLAEMAKEETTGTGMNYRDMLGIARIRQGTGLTQLEAGILKQMDPGTLMSMNDKDFEKYLREQKIDARTAMPNDKNPAEALRKKLIADSRMNLALAISQGSGVNIENYKEDIMRGDLSRLPKEFTQVSTYKGKTAGASELELLFPGTKETLQQKTAREAAIRAQKGEAPSEEYRLGVERKTMGGQQEAEMMIEALKGIKDAKDGFKVLKDLADTVKNLKKDPEKEYKEAARAADTQVFKQSVDKFEAAVNVLAGKLGLPTTITNQKTSDARKIGLGTSNSFSLK